MKTIFVKLPQENKDTGRRCLNCGRDISHKRKDTKFCCKECYNAYHEVYKRNSDWKIECL